MIRLLQKDNRLVKVMFAVIIGAAILSMVVYLVPGLYDGLVTNGTDVYATVHPPTFWGRIFGDTEEVRTTDVSRLTSQLMQRSGYPAFYQPMVEAQARQLAIAWVVEDQEAERLGLKVTDADVRSYLHQGQLGQYLFPNGKFIGDDQYRQFVQNAFGFPTAAAFEGEIKKDVERQRLREFVTAGITVSDSAVRDAYRLQGTKLKIDYAVITPEDVQKDISATDSELQNYFNENKSRYAKAVPETRKISYIAVSPDALPGGKPQVTDADLQSFYNQHQDQFKVEDQVKVRHILISVPAGADAKTDAAAKAKAQGILDKVKAGGDFAALAKENSDDPGSKATGGELGWVKKNGQMVPEFEAAAMSLQKGQTSGLVKTQFGYHILQAEDRQNAHEKSLAEVTDEIRPILQQQKLGVAEQQFGTTFAAEAAKVGMDKAAADHHLQVQTAETQQNGVVNGIADSTQLLTAAFAAKKGDAPKMVTTGEGLAVYQVADITAAHAPTFDQWKDHIASDYKQQQIPAMMQQRLAKLATLAKQYKDLKKAAAELKVTVKTSDLLGRDGNVPDLGVLGNVAAPAFNLAKGDVVGPLDAGRNAAVVQIVDKQEPTAEETAAHLPQMRDQLLEKKRDEVFGVYMGTLLDQYKKKGGIRILQKPKGNGPMGF